MVPIYFGNQVLMTHKRPMSHAQPTADDICD